MGSPLLSSQQIHANSLALSTGEDPVNCQAGPAMHVGHSLGARQQSQTSSSLSLTHPPLCSQLGQAKTGTQTQSLHLNHQPQSANVHQSEPVTIRNRLRSASTAPEQQDKRNSTADLNPTSGVTTELTSSSVPAVLVAFPADVPPGVTGLCQIGCGRVLYLNSNVSKLFLFNYRLSKMLELGKTMKRNAYKSTRLPVMTQT